MKTEFLTNVVGLAVGLIISAAGCWYMLDLMDQDMKKGAQQRVNSNRIGPLDDAIADMAGVPRRPKPKPPTTFTID